MISSERLARLGGQPLVARAATCGGVYSIQLTQGGHPVRGGHLKVSDPIEAWSMMATLPSLKRLRDATLEDLLATMRLSLDGDAARLEAVGRDFGMYADDFVLFVSEISGYAPSSGLHPAVIIPTAHLVVPAVPSADVPKGTPQPTRPWKRLFGRH